MGLSGFHMFVILIVVLVAFGPSRLGPLGRSFGEAMRGFKKGLNGDEIDVTDSAKRENLNQAPPTGNPYVQSNQNQQRQTAPVEESSSSTSSNKKS